MMFFFVSGEVSLHLKRSEDAKWNCTQAINSDRDPITDSLHTYSVDQTCPYRYDEIRVLDRLDRTQCHLYNHVRIIRF